MYATGDDAVVEMTRSLTSTLMKLMGWFFVGIGALMLVLALGAGLVALDVGGMAEWFAEHSTECGPTGGSSYETCSDTGEQPEVGEVQSIMWFLFGLLLFLTAGFGAAGWATFWFGRRSRRWVEGITGPTALADRAGGEPGSPTGPLVRAPGTRRQRGQSGRT